MPLQSLLDWLSKPKGPTLMETSMKVAPYKALTIAFTKRTLYEEKPTLVGVGLVYRLHCFHSAVWCCLHALECMAFHCLQRGVREPVGCSTPPVRGHLRDERCHTCCGTAPHLIGFDIPGGGGRHWRAYVSPLLPRLPTPYNLDSDSWRGDDSPYSFPSFPRGEQLVSDRIRVGEAPPSLMQGPKIAIGLKPLPKTIGTSNQT